MGIRILPHDLLQQQKEGTGVINNIELLLLPNFEDVFKKRMQRLETLIAQHHPFSDYLSFVLRLVKAQRHIIENTTLLDDVVAPMISEYQEKTPLNIQFLPDYSLWQTLFAELMSQLKSETSDRIQDVLHSLREHSAAELDEMATLLLSQQFDKVESHKAVFIGAAINLIWTKLASTFKGSAQKKEGEQLFCPLCAAPPICAVIQTGHNAGVRYLHCSLCETEWYFTRAKCTNCGETDDIHYFFTESENNPIKMETCGNCHHYLKIIYKETLPNADPIADDLATLMLNVLTEEDNFSSSALNPFLFFSAI